MKDHQLPSGYCEVSHTADLALEVWAIDLPNLFIQAAKGMFHIMQVKTDRASIISRKISIKEMDEESLLVSFLDELLNEVEEHKTVYDSFQIGIDNYLLSGVIRGKRLRSYNREIKAVTFNELKIIKTDSGYTTKVVFDI